MPLKRKRPAEDASPDPPSTSTSTSDLSSIASSNDAGADQDAVPTVDAPRATFDLDATVSAFSDRRVTNRTKTLVRLREQQKCWLCGFHGVHVAHVVARADAILLSSYIEQGLLPPDFGFHGLPNLMLLCAGCHHNFDVRIPVWAFLPSDLQSFVDRELEFHRLRDIAAASGIGLQREHRPNEEVLLLPPPPALEQVLTPPRSRIPATSCDRTSSPRRRSSTPHRSHGPATRSPRSYAARASSRDTAGCP